MHNFTTYHEPSTFAQMNSHDIFQDEQNRNSVPLQESPHSAHQTELAVSEGRTGLMRPEEVQTKKPDKKAKIISASTCFLYTENLSRAMKQSAGRLAQQAQLSPSPRRQGLPPNLHNRQLVEHWQVDAGGTDDEIDELSFRIQQLWLRVNKEGRVASEFTMAERE